MNISSAKYAGRTHREIGVANQDYVIVRHITNNISIAVLSDGAGSKKYGGITAEYIVNIVEQYCIDNVSRNDFMDGIKKELFNFVNEKLFSMIRHEDSIKDDYGATMLFVVVCDKQYVAGHIGDGIILHKTLSGFNVLSLPDNGQYVNQTYFVPTEIYDGHFRIYEGVVEKEFCFILTSDGISGTLYDQIDNHVSCACEHMYQLCKMYSSEECDRILEDNLVEVFDKYTDDDKSIAIICDSR